jgi:hypothetical protein
MIAAGNRIKDSSLPDGKSDGGGIGKNENMTIRNARHNSLIINGLQPGSRQAAAKTVEHGVGASVRFSFAVFFNPASRLF